MTDIKANIIVFISLTGETLFCLIFSFVYLCKAPNVQLFIINLNMNTKCVCVFITLCFFLFFFKH